MKKHLKYTLLSLLVLLFVVPAVAQDKPKIKWYGIEEAVALNKKKKKKFFIDLYTDWCGWCKKMDATTFTDPVIVEYMNENFYAVKLDAETSDTITINGQEYVNPKPGTRRSSHQLAIALLNGKMSYPSFAFLDEEVKMITVLPGYNPPEKLEPVLHYIAQEAYKKESYQDFFSGFKGSFGE
jgi:thioredoxin-related protein